MSENHPCDHCGSTHLKTRVVRIPTSGGGIDPFEITFRDGNLCENCYRTYQRETLPGIIRILQSQKSLNGEGNSKDSLDEEE